MFLFILYLIVKRLVTATLEIDLISLSQGPWIYERSTLRSILRATITSYSVDRPERNNRWHTELLHFHCLTYLIQFYFYLLFGQAFRGLRLQIRDNLIWAGRQFYLLAFLCISRCLGHHNLFLVTLIDTLKSHQLIELYILI